MDLNNKRMTMPATGKSLHTMLQADGLYRLVQYRFESDAHFDVAIRDFIALAQRRVKDGKPYNAEPLREPISQIVDWLFQAGRSKLDYSKGILLKGAVGRGKNVLLDTLAEMAELYELRAKRVKDGRMSMIKVTPSVRESTQFAADYTNEAGGVKSLQVQGMYPSLIIHDLGKEPYRTNSFGNSLNVVEYLIDIREANGLLTFATTNYNHLSYDPKSGGRAAEYAGYDDRTVSRMYSLFNVINLNHNIDFRKQ